MGSLALRMIEDSSVSTLTGAVLTFRRGSKLHYRGVCLGCCRTGVWFMHAKRLGDHIHVAEGGSGLLQSRASVFPSHLLCGRQYTSRDPVQLNKPVAAPALGRSVMILVSDGLL